jgi:hypothetical protein
MENGGGVFSIGNPYVPAAVARTKFRSIQGKLLLDSLFAHGYTQPVQNRKQELWFCRRLPAAVDACQQQVSCREYLGKPGDVVSRRLLWLNSFNETVGCAGIPLWLDTPGLTDPY